MAGCAISGLVDRALLPVGCVASIGVNPRSRCASGIRGEPLTLPWSHTRQGREELGENGGIPRLKGKPRAASCTDTRKLL